MNAITKMAPTLRQRMTNESGFEGPSPIEALENLAAQIEAACERSPRAPHIMVDAWSARAIREALARLDQ